MPTTRINDRETERKMLDVAVSLVHQQGISAELDDLAFEQIVQEAGVPRDSAYRRWPKLHKFYGEVLLELASGTTLPVTESAIAEPAGAIVLDRIEQLHLDDEHQQIIARIERVNGHREDYVMAGLLARAYVNYADSSKSSFNQLHQTAVDLLAPFEQEAGGIHAALEAVAGHLVQVALELQDGQGGYVDTSHELILHHMRVMRGTFECGVSRDLRTSPTSALRGGRPMFALSALRSNDAVTFQGRLPRPAITGGPE